MPYGHLTEAGSHALQLPILDENLSYGGGARRVSSLSCPLVMATNLHGGPPASGSGRGASLGASHPRLWFLVARMVAQWRMDNGGVELGLWWGKIAMRASGRSFYRARSTTIT
jgi:hypothetical protein